jgi:hypothetical protein
MQVADCYIHVKYRPVRSPDFRELSDTLLKAAIEHAQTVTRARELDFTLDEGSLFHRLVLWGHLFAFDIGVLSHYHDLTESISDMVHQGEAFSNSAIDEFHQITHTTQKQVIYKRTSSRDMNRLYRIVDNLDRVSRGNVPRSELARRSDDVQLSRCPTHGSRGWLNRRSGRFWM